jgi:molybdopterin-containing oxidoreductase family membrane subunit
MHASEEYHYLAGYSLRSSLVLGGFALVVALAGLAAFYMASEGHWVTGMTNHVPWGLPHVFAFFFIISASGALNVASIGSVFDEKDYKSLGRLSAALAFALLAGGLSVVVFDLGRVDRLVIALLYFNARSIFAWNVFIYQIFFGFVILYLWMMMDPRMAAFYRPAGTAAFLWRLFMTTGTGSVLGFLVSRAAYRPSMLGPVFIALSLSFGTAIFVLVLLALERFEGRPVLTPGLGARLSRLLGLLVGVSLYFILLQHLTGLYQAERREVEDFLLFRGGLYPVLLWGGFVIFGSVLPMMLLFDPLRAGRQGALAVASALVVFGGFCLVYFTVIGGEVYPLELFPGMQVSSSAFDGVVTPYWPTLPELALGLGAVGVAGVVLLMATWALPLLPGIAGADTPEPGTVAILDEDAQPG